MNIIGFIYIMLTNMLSVFYFVFLETNPNFMDYTFLG